MSDVNSARLRHEQAAQLEERPARAAALGQGRFACRMIHSLSPEMGLTGVMSLSQSGSRSSRLRITRASLKQI